MRNIFSIKMNGKMGHLPRSDHLDSTNKTLKGSYFPRESEPNSQKGRENWNFNEQWRSKGKATMPPTYFQNKNQLQPVCRQESKMQFRNAEKLKHFEQMKASNIDDLNCKIQKMISKLTDQISPSSSGITKGSKIRMKTDYSDLSSTYIVDSQAHQSGIVFESLLGRGKEMMESNVIKQSQILQEKKFADNVLGSKADAIRKKYKIAPQSGKTRQIKHEKSMSALNNSTFNQKSQYDAQLIRFRQKLKINNEKGRKQFSRQLNIPITSSIQKPATAKPNKKRNIDEDMKQYEKRLNKYDSKKILCLAKQGQFERVPLGDKTNSNNSYLKYSPYINKKTKETTSNCKLRLKREEPFQLNISDSQQVEQPLTADFRQPSDKNQLKLLLKNLQGQISLDQQFRNSKKWFQRLSYESKWQELGSKVLWSNLDLDQTAIRQIFSLKQQEQNPFFTPRQTEYDYQQMVNLFIRCEQHWFQNMVKQYNEQRLLASGFKQQKLDISGKGYISIEDLVRFLNLQMDVQVRNRDLLMIFQRLRGEQDLRFWQFLEVICE